MHKVKLVFKHVYDVYMYIAKNFCHEGATVSPFYCCCVQVESSYPAATVRSAPVVSLHNGFRGTLS